LASITPTGFWPSALDDSFAWFWLTCNFTSTDLPGFAAVAGSARAEALAARVFAVALTLFDALLVLAETLERRALALLPDFAFADRAALPFAADRDGREAGALATALRLRDRDDLADALVFFETVLDDFLLAFFRAAMAQTLQTQDDSLPAQIRDAGVHRPIVNAVRPRIQRFEEQDNHAGGLKHPINKSFSTNFSKNQKRQGDSVNSRFGCPIPRRARFPGTEP
jgi:hypothetical protein